MALDLRQPLHDTSESVYAGCLGESDGRDRTSFVIEDPLWHSLFYFYIFSLCLNFPDLELGAQYYH